MFSEIEQEEIINRFLDNIYVNDMFKIMKNETLKCLCKMEDEKVELAKLNLPHNLINNICKFNYQKCQDCKYLWELPKIIERKDKCKAIDGLTFMFVNCHFFPKEEVLREEFIFSVKKNSCLKQTYRRIGNNDIDMIISIIMMERFNQDRTIADLNKIFKYINANKQYRKHLWCSQFVECPVFRIPHFPEHD